MRLRLIKLLCIVLRHPTTRVWSGNGYRGYCPCGEISYKDIPFTYKDPKCSKGEGN